MEDWILVVFLVLLTVLVAGWVCIIRTVLRRLLSEESQRFAFRMAAALTSAVLVFVLVYLSSISAVSQMGELNESRSFFIGQGQRIREALAEYRKQRGQYPSSLDQLPGANERFVTKDLWQHPLQYSVTADGYTLASLGRDGKVGGDGLDADIDLSREGPVHLRPTLWQLLFETRDARGVFTVALLACLTSGLTCYIASKPRQQTSVTVERMVASIIVTTISAAFVSSILVLVYFVSSH
jgi:general secretion pathway protein G